MFWKKNILEKLENLEKEVGLCEKNLLSMFYPTDKKAPSLIVWCLYERFRFLVSHEFFNSEIIRQNMHIYELLETDKFNIDARKELKISIEEIKSFIQRIKSQLI